MQLRSRAPRSRVDHILRRPHRDILPRVPHAAVSIAAEIRSDVASRLPRVALHSTLACVLLYCAVGIAAFSEFGADTKGDIFLNFCEHARIDERLFLCGMPLGSDVPYAMLGGQRLGTPSLALRSSSWRFTSRSHVRACCHATQLYYFGCAHGFLLRVRI